ncbi:50S ribosomal protein L31e [Halorutilales archaeon Cl-col2-1]|nr:50S ribosomal protein L31e [Halobacteria archaeon]
MEERVMNVPLRDAKKAKKYERADEAMKIIRDHLSKHLKADEDEINLDSSINEEVWSNGRSSPPSKVRVRAAKFDDGVVEAEIAE